MRGEAEIVMDFRCRGNQLGLPGRVYFMQELKELTKEDVAIDLWV